MVISNTILTSIGVGGRRYAVVVDGKIAIADTVAHELGHLWHLPKVAKKNLDKYIDDLAAADQILNEVEARATQNVVRSMMGVAEFEWGDSFWYTPGIKQRVWMQQRAPKTISIAKEIVQILQHYNLKPGDPE